MRGPRRRTGPGDRLDSMRALLVLVAAGLSGPVSAQSVAVPDGQRLVLTAEGVGVQMYACNLFGDGEGRTARWVFLAPQAELFVAGRSVGMHGAGPIWTYFDGSSVRGRMLASANASAPDAIPSLLLQAAGSMGNGLLQKVTYIVRSDTSGGIAPTTGCDLQQLGNTSLVPYKAAYRFYEAAK